MSRCTGSRSQHWCVEVDGLVDGCEVPNERLIESFYAQDRQIKTIHLNKLGCFVFLSIYRQSKSNVPSKVNRRDLIFKILFDTTFVGLSVNQTNVVSKNIVKSQRTSNKFLSAFWNCTLFSFGCQTTCNSKMQTKNCCGSSDK